MFASFFVSSVFFQNKRTAMHYAAAARDGGHYLKILGKAGADPIAIDNVTLLLLLLFVKSSMCM